jgi:DNA modification methylase
MQAQVMGKSGDSRVAGRTETKSDIDRLSCEIIAGDSMSVLKRLQTERPQLQVHCVVTSPPYFKKRQYGDSHQEIGREDSLDCFCQSLTEIFNAVPLHPLGSVWVNLGDKRGTDNSLLRVPHRFCEAMSQSGWQLVDEVVWAKALVNEDGTTAGGCMTEPAPGRLNGNGFEPMYRFCRPPKGQKAWTDTSAVRLPRQGVLDIRYLPPALMKTSTSIEGRNLSNVWRVPMGQSSEKHYAVFPPALVERPIAMTCPMWTNPDGSLRSRIVEMVKYNEQRNRRSCRVGKYTSIHSQDDVERSGRNDSGRVYIPRKPFTVGWTPLDPDWQPGIVLDPFCGTGTTGEVALKMGRSFIGIDLYPENCQLATTRCTAAVEYLRSHNLNPFGAAR